MILLYAHKTDIKRKGDKQYGIFMDGIYYKLQLTKKISVPMVLTSCLTDSIIDSFVQREYNKGVFIPNYSLFRPELLLPWQIQNASTLSQKGQARLGVVGLCLTPGTCLPEKLAIVKHVDKYKVVMQTRDKPSINRFPAALKCPYKFALVISHGVIAWVWCRNSSERQFKDARFLLIISLSDRKSLWLDGYEHENYNFAVIL